MADVIDDGTGAPLEGDSATQAFLGGGAEVHPDADGKVRVVKNGQFGAVPADQLEQFLRGTPGSRLATQAETNERALSREYGEGVGNELRTGAEATARAATLGLSDALIGEIGGDDARTGLRERRERNKLSDTAGTVLGIGATALATGGSGGLAKALSATPAGLALKAGAAIEHGIGATTMLGRAGALAAGGALEGAVFGAGEGVTDWALNPDAQERTAERLMASVAERGGKGALLGGLAAGGLSLTAGTIGKGGKAALNRIKAALGKGESTAAREGLEAEAGQLGRASSSAKGEGSTTSSSSVSQRGRAAVDDTTTVELELSVQPKIRGKGPLQELVDGVTARERFAARQQRATTEISGDVTEIARTADELFGRTGGVERKQKRLAQIFKEDPPANLDVVNGETLARLEALDDELAAAGTEVHIYEKRGLQGFKAVREDIGQIAGQMRIARNADELAANVRGLDRLKQRLGQVRNSLESGMNRDASAAALMNKHYESLRLFLEDASVLGEGAAALQKENNAAITGYLDYARSFDSHFALEGSHRTSKSVRDPFQRVAEADPQKIGSALKGLGKAESAKVEEVLITGAQRQVDMLETLAKNYDLSPAELAKVQAAKKAAKRIVGHADELKSLQVKGDRWDDMIARLGDIPWVGGQLAKLKVSTARGLSLAMEGAAEAGAGAVVDTVADASAQASAINAAGDRLGAMQRIYIAAQTVGQKVSAATERYARTMGSAGSRAAAIAASTTDARAASKERKAEFDKSYAAVKDFQRNPEAAVRRAFRTQASLGTTAPILANTYAQKTIQAAAFLSTKLPGSDPQAHLFATDPSDVQPPPHISDDEIREYMKYQNAVERPLTLLDELEAGRVRPQTVEAVKAVYPRLYADIQNGILESMASAEKDPPYRARLQLGVLFDLPTDASLEPEFLAMLQASGAGAASSPQEAQNQAILSPSQRSAPELAGQVESRSASLQQGI